MKPIIVCPRRVGYPERDRIWEWLKEHYWDAFFPDIPRLEGYHVGGPFNRSAAINRAVELAVEKYPDWDVVLIIDADVFHPRPDETSFWLSQAILQHRMVLPYATRVDLPKQCSYSLLQSNSILKDLGYTEERYVTRRYTGSVSGMVAVGRKLWEAVGGFDEKFTGWGCEDTSFAFACETFAGRGELRGEGTLYHLWHESAKTKALRSPEFQANKARRMRYYNAIGNTQETARIRHT